MSSYQRERTSTDITIHVGEGEISGNVKVTEHEHSDGPYAVVALKLPGTEITMFPGKENVADLAAALLAMGTELSAIAETFKVSALED
jgi:hypothetical protein